MTELPLTGHCLCGGVRYEIDAPPISSNYCHCTRCQRRSGTAASANAHLAPGSLRFLSGEELVSWYDPGDGGWQKGFCSECGSALFSRDPEDHDDMGVRLGGLDPGHGIRPEVHQFVAYAADWEQVPEDGLPWFPESSRRRE